MSIADAIPAAKDLLFQPLGLLRICFFNPSAPFPPKARGRRGFGRHNRAAGFNADLEKYLEAGLSGWRVFRIGPDQITMPIIERLAAVLSADQ